LILGLHRWIYGVQRGRPPGVDPVRVERRVSVSSPQPAWRTAREFARKPRRSSGFPYDAGSDASSRGRVMIDGFLALYIFMLAAFTGYEIIARVPVILHTPLMSGSNFVHGIVLVGAMIALGHAQTTFQIAIGFIGVLLGAGNAAGGYVVTERMLEMFKSSKPDAGKGAK